jgi:hypothetical protein
VQSEEADLDRWLRARAEDLCGAEFDPQLGLGFGSGTEPGPRPDDVPTWRISGDPSARLGSFKADSSQTPARRQEADGVLQIYQTRVERLNRRRRLEQSAPATIGLLLISSARDR